MHFEIVSCAATQPNTGAAATAFTGDSLTVKNAIQTAGKKVQIVQVWQTNQVAGFGQITFPSGHDTTRGWRAGAYVGVNPGLLPLPVKMEVQPQELLSVTIAGSNVAGAVEQLSMLVHYDDLPGVDARLMKADAVERQMEKLTTVEQSITSVAGPGYSGEVAINTTTDLLLANRNYAVLGMKSRTQTHALTLRGPDLGNLRVGCPGVLRDELTSQWFMLMSRLHDLPMVPVINSGNKNSTFVGVAADQSGGTYLVTLYLALLK